MSRMNGGSLVVKALRDAGVDTLFGLHGAHIDTIFQAALDQNLAIVDVRHEVAAGHAAEGWARLTGKPGVALVTAGGGFTNVVTSIANAWRDRTPVVYLAGSSPLGTDETNTLQADIDQVAVAAPITKWAHRVVAASHIPRLIAQALRIAGTAPRGPVLLDIPWDMLTGEVSTEEAQGFGCSAAPYPPSADPAALEQALALLDQAQRPVMVVGGEAVRSATPALLARVAQTTGVPVFADFEGLALLRALPAELNGGLIQGLYGFAAHGLAPDAVLMLGTRFGLNTAHGSGDLIPHTATTIQVDSDPRELGRLQQIHSGIVADPGAALAQLDTLGQSRTPVTREDWQAEVRARIRQRQQTVLANARSSSTALHPAVASQIVADHLDPNTTVVADGALTYLWLSEFVSGGRPRALLCHGFLGSMGVGLGTTVGAQAAAAREGGRVVLVTGDGAVGFSLAEFDTLVRHGLAATVVVMNNRSWGATMHFQEMVAGPNRLIGTRLENGSYAEAAAAFGMAHHIVCDESGLRAALAASLTSSAPCCIEVMVMADPIPPEELILMGQPPF